MQPESCTSGQQLHCHPPLLPQLLAPMRQYMVQKDKQAHPTDSGTAASRPTLLKALGSVSMICPICAGKSRSWAGQQVVELSAAAAAAATDTHPMLPLLTRHSDVQPCATVILQLQVSQVPVSSRSSASHQQAALHARRTIRPAECASCCHGRQHACLTLSCCIEMWMAAMSWLLPFSYPLPLQIMQSEQVGCTADSRG